MKSNYLAKYVLPAIYICAVTLLGASETHAQFEPPEKISGSIVADGDVEQFAISPDGAYVVYIADQSSANTNELFSVSRATGSVTKLDENTVPNGHRVLSFEISSDSRYVVYRFVDTSARLTELFSVPIGGGSSTKLNDDLVAGGEVEQFVLSPDGSTAIYRGDAAIDNVDELFSVPITGGTPIRLNGDIVSGGDVKFSQFMVSPDSSRVVYLADQDTDAVTELYSVAIGGGTPVKLNPSLLTDSMNDGRDVSDNFIISPDSQYVVYRADQEVNNTNELYSVPIMGGSTTRLNGNLPESADVFSGFRVTPDSASVLYHADQNQDNLQEIFRVPITGGTPVRLSGDLVTNGGVSSDSISVSPDGQRVLYIADQLTDGVNELFSVPIEGGVSVRLNTNLVTDGNVFNDYLIIPDGSAVVYRADQNINEHIELYTVPISGGTPVRLNADLTANSSVLTGFAISRDSQRVVYRADLNVEDEIELFSSPVSSSDDGNAIRLNQALPSGASIDGFAIAETNDFIVFSGGQDKANMAELFLVAATVEDEEICFPIVASNEDVAVICL